MNNAPTIVARISKLERNVEQVMHQLGLLDEEDARRMVEGCLVDFEAWQSSRDLKDQAA